MAQGVQKELYRRTCQSVGLQSHHNLTQSVKFEIEILIDGFLEPVFSEAPRNLRNHWKLESPTRHFQLGKQDTPTNYRISLSTLRPKKVSLEELTG